MKGSPRRGGCLPAGEDFDGGMPRRGTVRGQEGPRANVNADVPPQLLDVIVQRATQLLAAQELLLELSDPVIALIDLHLEDCGVLVGGAALALGVIARTALQDTNLENQPLLARPPVVLIRLQVGLRADLDLLEVGARRVQVRHYGRVLRREYLELISASVFCVGRLKLAVIPLELVIIPLDGLDLRVTRVHVRL